MTASSSVVWLAKRFAVLCLVVGCAVASSSPVHAGAFCGGTAPVCGGLCPRGSDCTAVAGACVCQPSACGGPIDSSCNGSCPPGLQCSGSREGCTCQPLGCCELSPFQCQDTTFQNSCSFGGGTFLFNSHCEGGTTCQPNSTASPAPATSVAGLAVGLAILIGAGLWGVRRARAE